MVLGRRTGAHRDDCTKDRAFTNPMSELLVFVILILYLFYVFQASLIMFELAWKMSKDTNDLVWLVKIKTRFLLDFLNYFRGAYRLCFVYLSEPNDFCS